MTFAIERFEDFGTREFRLIALDQIEAALCQSVAPGENRVMAIHDMRKRCKRLRDLIRLARHSFPNYRHENDEIRSAANILSSLRDSHVLVDTFKKVVGTHAGRIDNAVADGVLATFEDK